MVMVSLPSNETLRQKLVPGVGYCCDRHDHTFVLKNVVFGALANESSGMPLSGASWAILVEVCKTMVLRVICTVRA